MAHVNAMMKAIQSKTKQQQKREMTERGEWGGGEVGKKGEGRSKRKWKRENSTLVSCLEKEQMVLFEHPPLRTLTSAAGGNNKADEDDRGFFVVVILYL